MSGVRNSCETVETNSDWSLVTASSRAMERVMSYQPATSTRASTANPESKRRRRPAKNAESAAGSALVT